MPIAVGVSFRPVSRSFWFSPGDLVLAQGDRVVVETARGTETGIVRLDQRDIAESDLQAPLKRILRRMTDRDHDQEARNADRARGALKTADVRVAHHQLPMRLLSAEYAFDASQVTVYFTAESRVDFRELVKDLAAQLRCKVQLYQVGARDQAKMVGGIGTCGCTLCCATFLTEFAPISMKMAKDQSLFLNPVKFSGVCGKLMCCLRYEHEVYVDARRRLPQAGDAVTCPRGCGRVCSVDLLREEVAVLFDDAETPELMSAASVAIDRSRAPVRRDESAEDLLSDDPELRALEG